MVERCREEIWDSFSYRSRRCNNKAKKDGYCMIHHPDKVKERDEKRHAEFTEKMRLRKERMDAPLNRIKYLEDLLDQNGIAYKKG